MIAHIELFVWIMSRAELLIHHYAVAHHIRSHCHYHTTVKVHRTLIGSTRFVTTRLVCTVTRVTRSGLT